MSLTLRYLYDESRSPVGFGLKYPAETGWTNYYFAKNLQGDVTAIYRSDASGGSYTGTLVAKYAYDPFGQVLSVTNASGTAISPSAVNVANYNPFRYRGYYYDTESGFYYLQSRYYDPEICRFINADRTDVLGVNQGSLLQFNLFAYCLNDPINRSDTNGDLSLPNWAKIAIGVAAIAVGVAVTAVTGGATLPALVAGVNAAITAGAVSAVTSVATTAVASAINGDNFGTFVKKAGRAAIDGFSNGFMLGGIMAGTSQVLSGGFKVAAKLGAKTGRKGGISIGENVKILSPNHPDFYENGGTIVKIGKNLRVDVGSKTLLHLHIPGIRVHIPIGKAIAGIVGGLV